MDPKESAHKMFHCSVSTAVITLSLFNASHTAVIPFLSLPRLHIDDDVKMKKNHCSSLLVAFIIREEIRMDAGGGG